MAKKKVVSSGNGSIPKASMAMGKATAKIGGMGGQHLKHTPAGSCPKLSKIG